MKRVCDQRGGGAGHGEAAAGAGAKVGGGADAAGAGAGADEVRGAGLLAGFFAAGFLAGFFAGAGLAAARVSSAVTGFGLSRGGVPVDTIGESVSLSDS